MIKKILFYSLIVSVPLIGVERETKPPFRGNFAHAIVPSSTFAFGQNIFDAKNWVIYPTFNQQAGKDSSELCLTPALVYAFTDSFSLYTGLPITIKQKTDCCTKRGIGNLFAQLEYAFINQANHDYQNEMTIVGNVTLPTTHLSASTDCMQTCTTSDSAPTSFFIGTTASHISMQWYIYGSLGAQAYLKKNDTKQGATIYYEAGIGKNLGNTFGITTMVLLEFNGIYSKKDTVCDYKDENSGSNLIYFGPTFGIAGNRWFANGGIQGALFHHRNGIQNRSYYRSSLQFAVVF